MDKNEILALLIVAAAFLLAVRYFLRKKDRNSCGGDCLGGPSQKQKDKKGPA